MRTRPTINDDEIAPTTYVMRLQGRFGTEENARDFDMGIGALPITLGRAPTRTDTAPYHLTLDANDSTLSREHVRIEAKGKGSKTFEIVCTSKNGAVVNKQKILKDQKAPLMHNTPVRIGGSRFYIVLPAERTGPTSGRKRKADGEGGARGKKTKKEIDVDNLKEGQKVTYQQMLNAAFESGEIELIDGGATQKDLVDWIIVKFRGNVTTNTASVKKGIYSILNRHYKRVEYDEAKYLDAGKSPPIRWAPTS